MSFTKSHIFGILLGFFIQTWKWANWQGSGHFHKQNTQSNKMWPKNSTNISVDRFEFAIFELTLDMLINSRNTFILFSVIVNVTNCS